MFPSTKRLTTSSERPAASSHLRTNRMHRCLRESTRERESSPLHLLPEGLISLFETGHTLPRNSKDNPSELLILPFDVFEGKEDRGIRYARDNKRSI